MERFFNTAGPTKPDQHYHLNPLQRVDWGEIEHLVATERYFVLSARCQTSKITTLLAMMKVLNVSGRYACACAYANIEGAQAARGDETQGIPTACDAITTAIRICLQDDGPKLWLEKNLHKPAQMLSDLLTHWTQHSAKPTVLLLDEVDALVGDTLISLLRQIRAGYAQRPEYFPQSIVLCGIRDVRDYRMHQEGAQVITGHSAFNIKAESLHMGNFSPQETRGLWLQHTQATGQAFAEEIFPSLWADTEGQPWRVNALGHELIWKHKPASECSRPISLDDYLQARERLIYSRTTYLDQLSDKLREPRVHSVLSAIGSKDELRPGEINPDDVQYVADLGLIQPRPSIRISNRIYQEVIPRELTRVTQNYIVNQEQIWYVTPEHCLDMPKLLAVFQQFFRGHSDIWSQGFDYKEAAPQLLMQVFLQRIINGGRRISREYGLGRKRTNLFIKCPTDPAQGMYGPIQRVMMGLKILRGALDNVLSMGLEQTAGYTRQVGADEAHLVIFDRSPDTTWDDNIWQRQEHFGVLPIRVWGV